MDTAVVDYLNDHTEVEEVWFYYKEDKCWLKTKLDRYLEVKPRLMRGRLQSFVRIESFSKEKATEPLPRPRTKVLINQDGGLYADSDKK